MPFAVQIMSGHDASVIHGPPFAGAAHAGLHFVRDEQDAVLAAKALERLQEFGWRGKIAALALNRLDEDCSDFLRIDEALEELLFDARERIGGGVLGAAAGDAAIGVRIRSLKDAGEQRAESLALHGLAGGERERAHRAAVEAAVEGDEFVAAGVITGELHRGFDGLGAGIPEVDALGFLAGSDRRKFLGEIDHTLVVEIRAGHVDQVGGLLLDRGDDARVAMSGGDDGDARREIEEGVAVDIFDHGAVAAFRDQRVIARVRRREHGGVALNDFLGFRAWQLGDELRQFYFGGGLSLHGLLPGIIHASAMWIGGTDACRVQLWEGRC